MPAALNVVKIKQPSPMEATLDLENIVAEIRHFSTAIKAITDGDDDLDRNTLAYFSSELKQRSDVLLLKWIGLFEANKC